MKNCSTCKQDKSIDQFPWKNKSKGTTSYSCSECTNERSRGWYKDNTEIHKKRVQVLARDRRSENTQKLFDYLKEHPCVDCGQTNPLTLEFDHQRDKDFNIADKMDHRNWNGLQDEISKCQVRCANCHKIKTAKDRDTFMHKLVNKGDW